MTVVNMIASPSPQRKILTNKNTPVMMSPGNRRRKDVGDYWLGKTLGRGSSGRVKIGIHKVTGEKVAIKIISKSHLATNASVERAVKREIAVMKLISHPNILHLLDVIDLSDSPNLYLVLEYVQGGELFEYLVSQGRLSEQEARKYFQQIILGLDYCHRHLICHRDLKPENLLLDSEKNIKIADFGMASLQPAGSLLETSCGSPHYASPEIVNGIPYDGSASDIWSCGIILYALLSGQLPFDDDNIRLLLNKVKVGKYQIPDHISDQAKDLIQKILVINPAKRLTMKEIQSHPWFTVDPPPHPTTLPDPPTAAEIGRPVASAAEIDDRILETLKVLWTDLSDENVVGALLNSQYNMQKVTYVLLQRHANSYWQTERDDDTRTVTSPAKRRRPVTICAIPERKVPFAGLNEMMAKMAETENTRNVPQMSPKAPDRSPRLQPSSRLSHDSLNLPLVSMQTNYTSQERKREEELDSPPPPPVPPKPKIIRTGHPFTPQAKPKQPWHFVPIHHNQPIQPIQQQPQPQQQQNHQHHMSWNPPYDYDKQQMYHPQQKQQQQQYYHYQQSQQKNIYPELYLNSFQQQQQQQYMPVFNAHYSPSNLQYPPPSPVSSVAPHMNINHMLSPRAPPSSALHHQNYTNQFLQQQQQQQPSSFYRSNSNQDSKLNKIFNLWQRNHRVDPLTNNNNNTKKSFMFDRKTLESSSSLWKEQQQLPLLSPINSKKNNSSNHHHQRVPSNHLPQTRNKTSQDQMLGTSPKLSSWLPGLFHFKQPKVCSLECEARDEREAMGKVTQAVEEYMDGSITERQDADGRIRRRGEMKLSNSSKTVKFKLEIFQLYSTKKKFVYRINFIQQQGDAMTLATAVKMVDQTLQTYEHEAELVTTANGWTTHL